MRIDGRTNSDQELNHFSVVNQIGLRAILRAMRTNEMKSRLPVVVHSRNICSELHQNHSSLVIHSQNSPVQWSVPNSVWRVKIIERSRQGGKDLNKEVEQKLVV